MTYNNWLLYVIVFEERFREGKGSRKGTAGIFMLDSMSPPPVVRSSTLRPATTPSKRHPRLLYTTTITDGLVLSIGTSEGADSVGEKEPRWSCGGGCLTKYLFLPEMIVICPAFSNLFSSKERVVAPELMVTAAQQRYTCCRRMAAVPPYLLVVLCVKVSVDDGSS